jgi:hypothetical protein
MTKVRIPEELVAESVCMYVRTYSATAVTDRIKRVARKDKDMMFQDWRMT